MSLLNWILPRGKPPLPRAQSLAMRPVRNPEAPWERNTDDDGAAKIVIQSPARDDRIGMLLTRLFHMPPRKTVELDPFGSELWELCDGKHSVEQMVKRTSETYKLNRRQAEISVTTFMRMLTQRHLIGFAQEGQRETNGARKPNPQPRKRRRH